MRLLLLTAVTMTAFAANSVLNRAGVAVAGMDPLDFGVVRLVSGALALAAIVIWQRRGFALGGLGRVTAVAGLLAYIFGFSVAYRGLDAGLGALLLFGVVQITMFGGALVAREQVPAARWIGAAVAMAGLVWLLWPSDEVSVPMGAALAMMVAGAGWGVYSLQGRFEGDATQATAMNFILAAPVALVAWLILGESGPMPTTGIALAVVSGVVTSGLGYALWYAVLPSLGATRAGVAQLSVPVIAMAGGMAFLAEPVTWRFVGAAVLVIVGVLISMRRA
ncbi:EamA-like transporter family protein [Shimia isoporae]|uniref:EamA-like transporter family protein n=1 Tax=Shimia isoporae TaxID=647720 RepID=A0A4R1NNN4_9RHOB|nr:DMT family transporter [Shimia isoporae]TCL08173.1 EamA-like transporter family protein [Shimia isoporae]